MVGVLSETERVLRAEPGDIDRLVTQLERHGTRSAKLRCGLLLLKNSVNKFSYEVFYSGWSEHILVLLITRATDDFRAVSLFAPEDPSSPARLERLLRCPELRSAVWSCRFRADGWPDHLVPALRTVADELSFSCVLAAKHVSYARPAGLPEVKPPSRPGVCIRPLLPEHTETVKHYWPYTGEEIGVDSIIGDGVMAGMSVGAFVTEPASSPVGDLGDQEEPLPADGLASWMVLCHDGGLGFLHTLSSQRRRGLAGLVLAELTRISEAAGYPPVLHSNHPAVRRTAQQLGYEELYPISWVFVTPPEDKLYTSVSRDVVIADDI